MSTAFASDRRYVWGYSGGAIVFTTALVLVPLAYATWTSFFGFSFASPEPTPVGLANYARLFTDPAFGASLATTALIAIPALAVEMVMGVVWALAITSLRRGRAVFTTLLALPVMVSGASAGMAFRFLFTSEWGPVDNATRSLTGAGLDWFGNGTLARIAITLADIWQNTPFVMLIALAALAAIPKEIGEASSVDGAGGWQRFWAITFPLIRKFLLVALLFRMIDLFRIFDVIFVMTGGGPASATETVSYYVYKQGVQFFDIGYAAAMGLALTVITVLISRGLIRVLEGSR